jgi:acyl-coenzyme A thioesterase PaaI-like protein
MNVHDQLGNLTGLDQLRALIASGRRPPIAEMLDFDIVEVEEGRAVFRGVPSARTYNPIGSVHGGYAATLLDSACGCGYASATSTLLIFERPKES